jgi:hypothetical protein
LRDRAMSVTVSLTCWMDVVFMVMILMLPAHA